MNGFDGLGMGLGNLARLSNAETRSISAENFTGEKGRGGMATEGTGAVPPASWGRAGRSRPASTSPATRPSRWPRSTGPGAIQHIWLTVASARTGAGSCCASTGTARRRRRSRCRSATSSATAGASAATSARCRSRSTRPAASTATGRCRSASRARITIENLGPDDDHGLLLPDRLHADRRAGRSRLLPRAVAAQQPAALPGGPHAARRRQRPGPLRRHLPRLGRQQQRLVGRGRDQVLPGRRRRVPDDLRHRHRGLLRRRLELRAPAGRVRRLLHARSSACRRSSSRTASTGASSGSACTAGTSWTRSASSRTCA